MNKLLKKKMNKLLNKKMKTKIYKTMILSQKAQVAVQFFDKLLLFIKKIILSKINVTKYTNF
jgi:hypothetical protein